MRILTDVGEKISAKRGLKGKSTYSNEIYKVVCRNGYRYSLSFLSPYKILPNQYLARQLQKVSPMSKEVPAKENKENIKLDKVAKKFVKEQQKSGLDVDKKGNIKYVPAVKEKREKKFPKKLDDYI